MKKKKIPRMNETSENIKGMNASRSRNTGNVKKIIDTIININPTAKEYVLFNIKSNQFFLI
jgi:hypothetical protein